MTYHDLMQEFRVMFDDPWGDTMGAWFESVGHMYERGLAIPDEWQYRPGVSPTDPDSCWYDLLPEASDETLTRFARTLARYADLLRANGMNY